MADFSAYPPPTPMAADMPGEGERHPNADVEAPATTESAAVSQPTPDDASSQPLPDDASPQPLMDPARPATEDGTQAPTAAQQPGEPSGGIDSTITTGDGGVSVGTTRPAPVGASPEADTPAPTSPMATSPQPNGEDASAPITSGGLLGGLLGDTPGGTSQGPTFLGFGLPIPGFLMEAATKMGFVWPQSDEMQLFSIGRNHISAGMEFNKLRGDVNDAVTELLENNESDGLAAFERFQQRLSSMAGSHMMVSGISAPALGIAYLAAGALVLAYKVHAIMILIEAAILLAMQAFSAFLGPLGLGGIAAKIAALRVKLMTALKAVQMGMSKVFDVAARVVEQYTKVATPALQDRPSRTGGLTLDGSAQIAAVPSRIVPDGGSPSEASPSASTHLGAPANPESTPAEPEPRDDIEEDAGEHTEENDGEHVAAPDEPSTDAWDDVIDNSAGGRATQVTPAPPTPPSTVDLTPGMARG